MKTKTKIIIAVLVSVTLGAFALMPVAQAVVPVPDGGYPGFNTAEGQSALLSLDTSTGLANTAVGWFSLRSNVSTSFNTGVGAGTLLFNTANNNTATGAAALLFNTTGAANSAYGTQALVNNTTGDRNTAMGWQALVSNTVGAFNTASGVEALSFNISGNFNIALGAGAGSNVIAAHNVICIGSAGSDVSDTTWINNIYGVTTQSGGTAPVIVSDGGQLGTVASAERFKKDIATMDKASENVLLLRPVTFHYKSDAKQTPQFGLIAEEVAKVNPALVLLDKEGKPYTVRYDAVNAMLLNEFLKEHGKNKEQQAMIAELRDEVKALAGKLKEQAAQIQRVSIQMEATEFATGRIRRGGPARQLVSNDY